MLTLKEFVFSGEMLIAAHRGSSGLAPENTLAAFELAVGEGANMIETDIHFTADGQVVAFHDINFLENTNSSIDFNNLTLDEIKKIDAGSWFDEKFTGEKIPSLQEILDFAKNKTYLNFEIKTNHQPIDDKQILNLLKIVEEFNMKDYLMFSSFNYNLIKRIKTFDNQIPIAAINIPNNKYLPSEISLITGAEAFICAIEELNEAINQDTIKNNIFLAVYSIDTKADLDYIKQFNIKALGTNYPSIIRSLINLNK